MAQIREQVLGRVKDGLKALESRQHGFSKELQPILDFGMCPPGGALRTTKSLY